MLCAGAPDTPEIMAEVEGLVACCGVPRRRRLDRGDAAAARRRRAADRRDGVRLPVDLRAARHRQPRGDGLRDRRRRHRHRRHPRGRRARRDRAAGPDRAGHRRHRHAARPGPVRRRLRRGAERGRRPTPTGRAEMGRAGRAARDRVVQLGRRSPSGPSRSTARCCLHEADVPGVGRHVARCATRAARTARRRSAYDVCR